MKAFSSIDDLKNADASEIAAVEGIPQNVAEGIFAFLHKEEE